MAATEMAAQKVKKARGQTPWASWPREKKEEIAKEVLKGSWALLQVCLCPCPAATFSFSSLSQLKYPHLPPKSTVYGGVGKAKANVALMPAGRPCHLQPRCVFPPPPLVK